MKRVLFLSAALLAAGFARAEDKAMTDDQKISYFIARQVGENLRSQGLMVDVPTFSRALEEALAGKPSAMTPEATQEAMKMAQAKAGEFRKEQGEISKKGGEDFLAANKKKRGVKVTKSGLQYKVGKNGKGPHPKATDRVKVNYRGTLINGEEFDSSYKRGQPAEFPLNAVIPGWTEAIQLMSPGAKYTFYIPGELAYGERGTPGIPPNATLIFEVELLEIMKQEAGNQAPLPTKAIQGKGTNSTPAK